MTGSMLPLLSRKISRLSLRLKPSLALSVYVSDRSPCIHEGSSFILYTCGIVFPLYRCGICFSLYKGGIDLSVYMSDLPSCIDVGIPSVYMRDLSFCIDEGFRSMAIYKP